MPFIYWKKTFDKCSTQIQDLSGIFTESEVNIFFQLFKGKNHFSEYVPNVLKRRENH